MRWLLPYMLAVIPVSSLAQSKIMPSPYVPVRLDQYTAYCALWRTDATFKSTIRISNQLGFSALDVTPTIYMADGTAMDLPVVHVPQASVATVDVNAALAQIPANIQPHLSSYGSAAIRYRYDWQGAAHAAMSILDLPRSLEYAYEFVFPPGQGVNEKGYPAQAMAARNALNAQAYEGLWFRRTTSAGGFLALANVSASTLIANVNVSGLRQPAGRSVSLPSHSTALIDLGGFFAGDSSNFGGITISQSGAAGDLQLAGGLQDLTTGYSTNLPLIPAKTSPGVTGSRQYASVGMMVNQQDPMLNFPSGLTFYPYAFLRNIASASRTLSFTAYYMDNGHVKSLPLPDLTLAPGQVAELPVHDILVKQTQVEDMNLVFSYSGDFGDILAATGSTDTTGNYVFPVGAQPISPSGAKKSIYWTTSGGFDTMYTVWNPGNASEDLLITLHYGANGDTYRLPMHLEPYASEMFDIGELIRTQQLDEDGKTIPFDAAQGSVIVGSAAGAPEDLINIAFAGGIYNPTKATCGGTCMMCQVGLVSEGITPGSFTVTVGGQQQSWLDYIWSDGTHYDVTNSSSWGSTQPAVATVLSAGDSYPGLATGVSAGTSSISAYYSPQVPVDTGGQVCGNPPACPTVLVSGSETATVTGPQCFAQLKYRPVYVLDYYAGNHSFWWIQDSTSTHWVADAGPQGSCPLNCGYLVDWVTRGDVGHYTDDNANASLAWSSGVSSSVCMPVTNLYNYAVNWPQTTYSYAMGSSPNSNTFSHWAGNAAPFSPTAPPNAPGW